MAKKSKSESPDFSFLAPGFVLLLVSIAVFAGFDREVYNSGSIQAWKSHPVSGLDLAAGAKNSLLAAFYMSFYFLPLALLVNGKTRIDKSVKKDFFVAMIYLVFALLMTYPLVFVAGTHLPGDGADEYWFAWLIDWAKKSVLGFNDFFHTKALAYPVGTTLILSTHIFLLGLISIPVQLLSGVVYAYNFLVFMSFVFTGYGMYKLVEYLTGDGDCAIACGLAFSLIPYRFAHLIGHMNLVSTQWLILFAFFFMKAMNERRRWDIVMSVVFLTATAYTEFTYLFFAVIYAIMYFIWHAATGVFSDKREIRPANAVSDIKVFAVVSAASIIFSSPLIYLVYTEYGLFDHPNRMTDSIIASANLFAYAIPIGFNPILGPYTREYEGRFSGFVSERVVYAGWGVLAMAFFGLYSTIKAKGSKRTNAVFWLLFGGISLLFSLGPYLHVGHTLSREYSFILPYNIIVNAPFLSIAKTPARYSLLFAMSVVVLAGYGISNIPKRKRRLALAAFTALVILEYMPVPYIVNKTPDGNWAKFLAGREDGIVFEFPEGSRSEYLQTIHGKTIAQGRIRGRQPIATMEYLDRLKKESLETDPLIFTSKHGIDYMVVHKNKVANMREFGSLLSQRFGEPIYADSEDAIYWSSNEKTIQP